MKIQPVPEVERLQSGSSKNSFEQYHFEGEPPMAWGENCWGPSPKVVRALRDELLEINRYPDNHFQQLKKSIADRHGVEPCEVIIGSGISHLVDLLLRAFVLKGEEVILSKPSHNSFFHAVTLHGARNFQVSLNGFAHDLETMKEIISPATRMILLDNPACVSGCAISPEAIYQFLSEVPETTLVVFNEGFIDYMEESLHVDIYSLIRNTKKRCAAIFLRSFSILYGLAGLRVSYGIMARSIVAIIESIQTPYAVNRMAVTGALAALGDTAYYQQIIKITCSERERLHRSIEQQGCVVVPSKANFLLIDTGVDADLLCTRLLQKGCVVGSMGCCGFPNHIRVTVGKKEENSKFLDFFKSCRGAILHA